jgi:DNA-binding transcriptional LysR family regulator
MRGSDYAELRAFATVLEQGNFARAAARLGVSPSALSQMIRGLEERLGMRLLNRTTRSVGPTEAGARLIARLAPVISEMEAAVAEIGTLRDKPAGLLRINASRIAAIQHIGPLLGPFHRAYPDIVLDITIDDTLTDIVAHRFDAGIRLGERLAKDMVAVKLSGELETMIVATPAYLKRRGVPKAPKDLHGHDCINFRLPSAGNLYQWEFERNGQALEVAVEGPLIVNDVDLALQASLQGVGVACLFDQQVQPLVKAGRLQRILEDWSPRFPGFYLYHPSRRQTPPPLRAFIDFLRQANGA